MQTDIYSFALVLCFFFLKQQQQQRILLMQLIVKALALDFCMVIWNKKYSVLINNRVHSEST